MTVSCPDCRSVFRVDPAKVPATGVRARCSVCGGVIAISGGTLPISVTPSSTRAVPTFAGGTSRATPKVSTMALAVGAPEPLEPAVPTASASAPDAEVSARSDAVAAAPARLAVTPTPMTSGTPADGRRPINPFLHADPEQRARRLARALVSDLVAYHPQKRDEGLRDGTLRQLFREEIKKSYEEYVEQVGRDAAEKSPHFQGALNEILGGGRKLF